MGFIHTAELMALPENTPKVGELTYDDFDALLICGGQSAMFTYPNNTDLQNAARAFYQAEKITGAFCHGVSAQVNAKTSACEYLVAGKTVTGISNIEENYGAAAAGVKVMPWRLEDALRERGANAIQVGSFKPFAVRDGRLVTGQQQYSAPGGGQARDRDAGCVTARS
jgi:putative intracellular protease/amidase